MSHCTRPSVVSRLGCRDTTPYAISYKPQDLLGRMLPEGAVACAPGLDCAHSFYCPAYTTTCPEGSLCSSYEGLANIDSSSIIKADQSYVKYKWQGKFGGLENENEYERYLEDGRYIQSLCIRGFYCPDNMSIVECPAGYWCPEGVQEPIPCDILSLCPSGNYYQVNFVNFSIACILSIVIFTLAFVQKTAQLTREKASRDMETISLMNTEKVSPESSHEIEGTIMLKDVTDHQESYSRPGIELKFRNITATSRDLQYSDDDRVILDNVSGELKAGEINGILGPSGCGKSTLISVLRNPSSIRTGLVEVVEEPTMRRLSSAELPKRIGFVPQEDIVDRQCTVRELLEFNCLARVIGISKNAVETKVESVLRDLKIRNIADTVIGGSENTQANISGGQVYLIHLIHE